VPRYPATNGLARPVSRRCGLPRICDLKAASRVKADYLHQPLAGSVLEVLHYHGHGRDDRAYGQAKPRIVFVVPDVARATDELRRRGFAPLQSAGAVRVVDPDGAFIVFTAEGSDSW